jgi:exonuclease SbcD
VRLLHTADWHLGKTLEGRSRLPEQEQFLDELAKIVEEEKVDVVLMAGDAFDTVNPSATAEQLFYESLARLADKGKRQVIVIAGNHDNPERLVAAKPLAGEQGITLLGNPITAPLQFNISSCQQKLNVAALPYPSESRLKELLEESQQEELLRAQYDQRIQGLFGELAQSFTADSVNVAMSHIFVAGGDSSDSERPIQVGGAYTVSARSLPEAAQYVALGHLHRPQTMTKANTMARYSGSPLAYSFSEAGYAKSVTLLDIDPGQPAQMKEIFLSSGKPLVKWKAVEGLQQVYHWLDEGRDLNAWIDLEIHLQNALSLEEIHRLRKQHTGLIQIRPVFEDTLVVEGVQRQANLPLEELFRRFYERQTGGAQPEAELTQLFLELLNTEKETIELEAEENSDKQKEKSVIEESDRNEDENTEKDTEEFVSETKQITGEEG